MPSRELILLLPLLLAGCLAQSQIQTRYDRDHGDCQDQAEHNINTVLPPGAQVSQSDRNAELLTLFSDCMGHRGWSVAKPKTTGTPTTDNSIRRHRSPAVRTQSVQQSPPPAPGDAPQPAPGINPGLMAPSPMPPSGPAAYQPGSGSGPGRNF